MDKRVLYGMSDEYEARIAELTAQVDELSRMISLEFNQSQQMGELRRTIVDLERRLAEAGEWEPTYFGMSLEQYAISLRDESNTLRNENLALKQELQAMQGKYGLPNYSTSAIHKELVRRQVETPGVPAIPAEVVDAIGTLVVKSAIAWDWIGYGKYMPQVQLLREWHKQAERDEG